MLKNILLTQHNSSNSVNSLIKKIYGIIDMSKRRLDYSKTFVEKAQKGFYFLAYKIEPEHHSVSLPETTLQPSHQRLRELYEHCASMAHCNAYDA